MSCQITKIMVQTSSNHWDRYPVNYPLVMTNSLLLKMTNLELIYLLKMVMFHSYVAVYQRLCRISTNSVPLNYDSGIFRLAFQSLREPVELPWLAQLLEKPIIKQSSQKTAWFGLWLMGKQTTCLSKSTTNFPIKQCDTCSCTKNRTAIHRVSVRPSDSSGRWKGTRASMATWKLGDYSMDGAVGHCIISLTRWVHPSSCDITFTPNNYGY